MQSIRFVIVEINNRLTATNILKYLPEWQLVLHFVRPFHLLLIAAVLAGWSIRIKISKSLWSKLKVFSVSLIIAGTWFELSQPESNRGYGVLAWRNGTSTEFSKKMLSQPYSQTELEVFLRYLPSKEVVSIPEGVRNVVLLSVESLSAVDSFRTSGLKDRLKRFDKLSQQGVLYTNFYANSTNTEGGMVALHVGVPPLPFPGSTLMLFESFRNLSSVPRAFSDLGYFTEFLTTGPLSFTSKGKFMTDLGFDLVRGSKEVSQFVSAPRFVFNSSPDEFLYLEALDRMGALSEGSRPYFLSLLTVTSHRPMMDPSGRESSEDNIWDYVDTQIERFYSGLQDIGFFEDGLLLITGDHRKMLPLTRIELDEFGEGGRYRVPLLIIGPGFKAGRIDDRLFQSSDLFSLLGSASDHSKPLSLAIIVPDNYGLLYTDGSDYGKMSVFDENGAHYRAQVKGRGLAWLGVKPSRIDEIEVLVHRQRALNQFWHRGSNLALEPGYQPKALEEALGYRIEDISIVSFGPARLGPVIKLSDENDMDFPSVSVSGPAPDDWKQGSLTWGTKLELNLLEPLILNDYVGRYIYIPLLANKASKAQILLGSDDTLEVWYKGEKMLEHSSGRPAKLGDHIVTLDLEKGTNHLYLRVDNFGGAWRLLAEVSPISSN